MLLSCWALFRTCRAFSRPSQSSTTRLLTICAITGSASLPPPSGKLSAVTLGRGTQNYTCAPGSTAAPTPIGAKALLLDVCRLLPLFPAAEASEILNQLPGYLLNYDFSAISNSSIPIIGQHYFANTGPTPANGTPTFDLGSRGFLSAKRTGGIKAPGSAGVDWLQLMAKAPSTKMNEVYRVETAKGQAPMSCAGQPANIEVQYAAQYWFYA